MEVGEGIPGSRLGKSGGEQKPTHLVGRWKSLGAPFLRGAPPPRSSAELLWCRYMDNGTTTAAQRGLLRSEVSCAARGLLRGAAI